jgi:RimJ/RimL family protein N-acetyltransferase
MIEISANHPALKGLFNQHQPNSPALWAVLEGRHHGIALVDRANNPNQCVLRTDAALTYMSRRTDQVFLEAGIQHLRKRGPIWLVWPHHTGVEPPGTERASIIPRLEFYDYDPQSNTLDEWRKGLPAGFEIRPIDANLFRRCEWREEMEFYAGGADNFLAQDIGLCILQGEEIIVEAYASALGNQLAEIGAITRPAYRGQGYAPIACAFLIQACYQQGYQAYWSCDADHTASIRVARKLGFRQERPYTIYEFSALP